MSSHFVNYVDLEITLVFDPGVRIMVTDALLTPTSIVWIISLEKAFSGRPLLENRKLDLEMISRGQVDPSSW